jgi:hypothetical protein
MGQPALKLDDLIERAGASVERIDNARMRASTSAVAALRQLEMRVTHALRGGGFRGMANLASAVGGQPYFGRLVHARRAVLNDRQGLAIDRSGKLVFVTTTEMNWRGERWATRAVLDADIRAADFQPILRVYKELLADHAARTERAAANYDEVQRLAERLKTLVNDAF